MRFMAPGKKKVPMLRYLYIAILRFVLAEAGNHAGEGLEIALREYAFQRSMASLPIGLSLYRKTPWLSSRPSCQRLGHTGLN